MSHSLHVTRMKVDDRELAIGFAIGLVVIVTWIVLVTLFEPFSGGALPGLAR